MGSARTAGGGSPAAAAGGKRRRKAPVTVLNRLGRAASEADCCATGVLVAGGAEANRLARDAGAAVRGGVTPTAWTLAVMEWTGVIV